MTWTLTLPVTPSLNQLRRMHWAEIMRAKEALAWTLVSILNKQPKIPLPTGPRRLVIERHGKKALDQDNLAGGAKDLIDCLRSRRLILDDTPDLCHMEFRQVICKRGESPHTLVILDDLSTEATA